MKLVWRTKDLIARTKRSPPWSAMCSLGRMPTTALKVRWVELGKSRTTRELWDQLAGLAANKRCYEHSSLRNKQQHTHLLRDSGHKSVWEIRTFDIVSCFQLFWAFRESLNGQVGCFDWSEFQVWWPGPQSLAEIRWGQSATRLFICIKVVKVGCLTFFRGCAFPDQQSAQIWLGASRCTHGSQRWRRRGSSKISKKSCFLFPKIMSRHFSWNLQILFKKHLVLTESHCWPFFLMGSYLVPGKLMDLARHDCRICRSRTRQNPRGPCLGGALQAELLRALWGGARETQAERISQKGGCTCVLVVL